MSETPRMMDQLQELTPENLKQRQKVDAIIHAVEYAKWLHQDTHQRTHLANAFAKESANEGAPYEQHMVPEPASHDEILDLARKYYDFFLE
jgi:nucleotide-binding universal stress UspA family protein